MCSQKLKSCNSLDTDDHITTSNVTNQNYSTRSYVDLYWIAANIIYGLECNLCGLASSHVKRKVNYTPETDIRSMRVRMIEEKNIP